MTSPAAPELGQLTAKEKETLRLIVRGFDAKSSAGALDLSVHTVNERLRAARRKLGVTSSREAARLLFESEGGTYENLADKRLGEADERGAMATPAAETGTRRLALTGAAIMSVLLAAVALAMNPSAGADQPAATSQAHFGEAQAAAQAWLNLVDARDWPASYAATAAAFRQANTLELWSKTASSVQGKLGATLSRRFIGADDVPSPQGFTIVKFRTQFANQADALETVSLVREDGAWKVAGIYVE